MTEQNSSDAAEKRNWATAWERARRQEVAREDRLRERVADSNDAKAADSDAAHDCAQADFKRSRNLGDDGEWDFAIGTCSCGRVYVLAQLESDGPYSRSGKWYMARFPVDALTQKFEPKTLRAMIGLQDRVIVGGSYWRRDPKWFELDPVGQPRSPLAQDLRPQVGE